MDQNTQVAVVVALVVAAGLASWLLWRSQQRQALVRRYGPEYRRIVREEGGPRKAEKELVAREKRVKRFELRELTPEQRGRYLGEWHRIQALFVDQPARAVTDAHALLSAVVRDRGYPDADLEQRQRDLSVNYPRLIEPYREACEIAERLQGPDAASTEDLRRATICYRSLLTALLDGDSDSPRARVNRYEAAS
jgi:hypothetical protein